MKKQIELKNLKKKEEVKAIHLANTNKTKGITLIALVITIIVLLILAGVSISMLTGENGILKRANEAKEETQRATEDEQRKMATLEAAMNTERTYFQGVPIPAGFAPTRIAGESTVDEGLVITDSQGNEFVWIPCVAESSDVGDTGKVYYNNGKDNDNREEGWREKQSLYNGGIWYDSQPHEIGIPSIQKEGNGGFYVARYEAGVPENATFYANAGNEYKYFDKQEKNSIEKIKTLAPVSKKGQQVWNFISQKNAVTVAGNMVNNSDVQSYLIDSHAWNTICRVISQRDDSKDVLNSETWGNYKITPTKKYEKIKGLWADVFWDASEEVYATNGKYLTAPVPVNREKGHYVELATGSCEEFKAYNIYDLAGNVSEWSTELGFSVKVGEDPECHETACPSIGPGGGTQHAVYRGGDMSFIDTASVVYANRWHKHQRGG